MKKKVLIISALSAVIVIIALIAVGVIAMNNGYSVTDINDKTVVAVVNGKKINAGDLNSIRMSIALAGSDYVSTEKELLDIVIKDYVIEDYVAENGYVYEEENEDLTVYEIEDDSQEYSSPLGLTVAEYEEIGRRNHKKNKIYAQYLRQVVGPLLSGEIKLDNEKAIELQAKYQEQIETGDLENMDWDIMNKCSLELLELFTQHLVDEADVVIYEDRLN